MKGYSLIELIVVITVTGILVLLTAISVTWQRTEAQLLETRDRLLADIEFIKINSVTREPHGILFFSEKYEVHRLDDKNKDFFRDALEKTVIQAGPDGTVHMPDGMSITWNSCGGNNELWFDRKGLPRCKNWGLGMGTFLLVKGSQKIKLTLDSVGKITYE